MRPSYLVFLIYTMAVLSACGHKQESVASNELSRLVKVKAEEIHSTQKSTGLHYSGSIEPQQTIPLSFEGIGTVDQVLVQEGDMVKKGQVIAILDRADNLSMSNAAVAKYKQAKDAYDRLKTVYEKGSLPEIKWVEVETNLKEAEAQMQLTQSSVNKCSMKAPTNAMVGKRNIEPGQSSVSLKTPIELVKIETVLVKISVAENEISKIKKGLKASFSIMALNGKTFEGSVSTVGVVADQISRTYEVKILAKNPNYEIKPGMVCDVNLNTQVVKDFVYVPNNAVSKDNDGKTYVFVLSPDKKTVKKQDVELGYYHGNGIEVEKGLRPGQLVVVEGKEKLSDNSLISL